VIEDAIQQARTTAERGDFESTIAMLRPLAEAGTNDAQCAVAFLALTEYALASGSSAKASARFGAAMIVMFFA
jgi:hypothetical protein